MSWGAVAKIAHTNGRACHVRHRAIHETKEKKGGTSVRSRRVVASERRVRYTYYRCAAVEPFREHGHYQCWRKMMELRQIDVVPAQIAGFRPGIAGGGGDPPAAASHVSETVIQDLPARRRLRAAASQCTE